MRISNGGEGGIRTPGRFNPSTVFKTAAFDHSATSPEHAACPAQGSIGHLPNLALAAQLGNNSNQLLTSAR